MLWNPTAEKYGSWIFQKNVFAVLCHETKTAFWNFQFLHFDYDMSCIILITQSVAQNMPTNHDPYFVFFEVFRLFDLSCCIWNTPDFCFSAQRISHNILQFFTIFFVKLTFKLACDSLRSNDSIYYAQHLVSRISNCIFIFLLIS